MTMLRNEKKRAMRRAWPIIGYCGPNGGGKTMAAVWDSIPTLMSGRPVLSTVRLLDFDNPRDCDDPACTAVEFHQTPEKTHAAAHPLYVPFTDWEQLLEARFCDVLMDEVTGVASSRESQSMPAPVANKLVQLRRADVVVRWTAPSWARADKIIRECSQAVTYCEGMLSKTSGTGDRLWRERRLHKWRTYDASVFEDFTSGKREQMSSLAVDWHWGPGSPARAAYDTYDAVLSIGTVSDAGRCYRCGGRRPVPACKCPDHAATGPVSGGAAGRPKAEADTAVPRPGRRRRDDLLPVMDTTVLPVLDLS